MKKKCLIIGGLGYIGTVVAPYLVKNNKNLKITCLDNLIYKQKVSLFSNKFKYFKIPFSRSIIYNNKH